MALQSNLFSMTYTAGAALTQFVFVDASTTADFTVVLPTAGSTAIGVTTQGAASGADVPVMLQGRVKVLVGSGAAVVRGDILKVDGAGAVVTATSGTYGVARACESAAASTLCTVDLITSGKA